MASSTRGRNARSLSNVKGRKVMERLQQKIEDGSFYEAHQTYRALYQRYCAQGSEEQAMSLLLEGASTLLKHEQWESGTDLGLLLVNHLKERHSPITEDTLDMISQLFVLYKGPRLPAEPSPVLQVEIDPREVFMRAALKWSSMVGGEDCKYGHPHLHKMLALSYWEAKQYARAREHFQYACQPEDYAAMLVEVAETHGHPREADLFLTQAVLQLLVLRNRRSAMGVYSVYTQTHPVFRLMAGPPYEDKEAALLNFTWFLLLSTESGDSEVFNFLRKSYAGSLSRDPCFEDYLDKIGVSFFGCAESAVSQGQGQSSTAPSGGGGGGGRGGGGALGGLLNLLGGGGAGGGGGLLENLMGSLSAGLAAPPQGTAASQSGPAAMPAYQPQSQQLNLLQSADIVD